MTKKSYPSDILSQAKVVVDAWNQINKTMVFGDLTMTILTTDLSQAAPIEAQIINLETQLTDKRNQRDTLYQSIWEKVKRVRNGVKGIYGDDSSQYEMVGGTRLSERKSSTRKAVKA